MIFKFFKFFEKSKIDFCIINGYKEIVAQLEVDSDIDILLKQDDFKNIEKIIKNFCFEENMQIVQKMHHDIWAKNFFLFNPKNGDFLNLDLYAELSRKGIVYFQEDEIFNTLKSYENIPILSNEKEFINYFIKKFDKNDFSKQNFIHLRSLYLDSNNLCNDTLKIFFPNYNNMVIDSFKNNNFALILENHYNIIQDFYALKSNNLKREIIDFKRTVTRIFNPTGLSISFLGPDGSGKSTIINELLSNRLPFRRKDYFHLKPFPSNTKNTVTVENPHSQKVYSLTKSYIKLSYFIYQYNFGWIKHILKLKIKSSLVIFDRYYDDLLVDHKRYRYGGSKLVAKVTRYFIPKPDLYFILTTNPKVIYERKQEVSFEELERQVKAYRELADNKQYFNIDVNRTPEEIVKEITLIIMEKMNERY